MSRNRAKSKALPKLIKKKLSGFNKLKHAVKKAFDGKVSYIEMMSEIKNNQELFELIQMNPNENGAIVSG